MFLLVSSMYFPERQRLACEPHVTLRVLSAELAERGISACHVSIWRVLKEAGFSFKKNAVRQ